LYHSQVYLISTFQNGVENKPLSEDARLFEGKLREDNMNINEQLDQLLGDLGVEMEHPAYHNPQEEDSLPEVSIFQSSRDHYGVFYRLDIIDQAPQLRIIVPLDNGPLKMEVYLVKMSDSLPLNNCFAGIAAYSGSSAFERGREAGLQHLLYAVAEMMKQLFWSGDLDSMTFSPEIEVLRLI
jgi:hypothetical protein